MKLNKKITAGIAVTFVATIVVISGSLAFFTDVDFANTSAVAGTVEIGVDEDLNLTNSSNVNPGDYDFSLSEDARIGTSHDFTFGITNEGTKSVVTRNVITIRTEEPDNNGPTDVLPIAILKNVNATTTPATAEINDVYSLLTGYELNVSETELTNKFYEVASSRSFISELELKSTPEFAAYLEAYQAYLVELEAYQVSIEAGNTEDMPMEPKSPITAIRYITPQTALNAASGLESEDTELNDGYETAGLIRDANCVSADFLYYFKFAKEAGELYEGSDIDLDLTIQAMQFRNTSSAEWETIFSDSLQITSVNAATVNDAILD